MMMLKDGILSLVTSACAPKRKNGAYPAGLILLVVLSSILCALSVSADTLQDVRKLVSSKPLYPKDLNKEFCTEFLSDFIHTDAVTAIRPVAVSDKFPDEVFSPYTTLCPNLEFHKHIAFGFDRDKLLPDFDSYSEEEKEEYGDVYYGTRNFKLYHIDLNQNSIKENNEYLFYSDSLFSKEVFSKPRYEALRQKKMPGLGYAVFTFSDAGYYSALDLNKCKRTELRRISSRQNHRRPDMKLTSSYTDVVLYRRKYYIYDVYSYEPLGMVNFHLYKPYRELTTVQCIYSS